MTMSIVGEAAPKRHSPTLEARRPRAFDRVPAG